MSIDSVVEGGVCTCMWEGRSDQWRFPLLSSAQQQMGRGCGLAGWVTRIMNLPVVLFNTWKKENENRNTCGKVGWRLSKKSKQATRRQTSPPIDSVTLVTTISCHILRKLWPKTHRDGAYFCQRAEMPTDAQCLQSQLLRNKLVLFTFESLPQWARTLPPLGRRSHSPHSYMCTPG